MYSGCMYFGLLRIGIVWMHADRKAIMHIYVSMFCICIQFRAVKHIRLILFNVVVLSFAQKYHFIYATAIPLPIVRSAIAWTLKVVTLIELCAAAIVTVINYTCTFSVSLSTMNKAFCYYHYSRKSHRGIGQRWTKIFAEFQHHGQCCWLLCGLEKKKSHQYRLYINKQLMFQKCNLFIFTQLKHGWDLDILGCRPLVLFFYKKKRESSVKHNHSTFLVVCRALFVYSNIL